MNRITQVVPFVGPAFAFFNFANAQGYAGRGRGGDIVEGLLQLLFLVVLVLGIIWLVQALRAQRASSVNSGSADSGVQRVFSTFAPKPAHDSALQILRERLAKGEIDPEDYEARRRVLTETKD